MMTIDTHNLIDRALLPEEVPVLRWINRQLSSDKPNSRIAGMLRQNVTELQPDIQKITKQAIDQLLLLREPQENINSTHQLVDKSIGKPVEQCNPEPVQQPVSDVFEALAQDSEKEIYRAYITPVMGMWSSRINGLIGYKFWHVFRNVAKRDTASGKQKNENYITRTAARQAIIDNGYGERRADGILSDDNGLFWDYDEDKGIYTLPSENSLLDRLRPLIPDDVFAAFSPGRGRYLVDFSKRSKTYIGAEVYNAFLYEQEQTGKRKKGVIYCREQLKRWFGVTENTFLSWEKIKGIDKRSQYVKNSDITPKNNPVHAYLRVNQNGVKYSEKQTSNIYYPQPIRKRATRGNAGRTYHKYKKYLQELENPNIDNASGDDESTHRQQNNVGIQRPCKMYFESEKQVLNHAKKDPFGTYLMLEADNSAYRTYERFNPVINDFVLIGTKPDTKREETPEFVREAWAWKHDVLKAISA